MCVSGLTRTTRTHDVFARASLRVGVSFDLPGFGLVKADNWLDDTGTVIEFAAIGLRNVTCRLPLPIGAVSISGNNVNGHRGFLVTRTHDILPCKSPFYAVDNHGCQFPATRGFGGSRPEKRLSESFHFCGHFGSMLCVTGRRYQQPDTTVWKPATYHIRWSALVVGKMLCQRCNVSVALATMRRSDTSSLSANPSWQAFLSARFKACQVKASSRSSGV